MKLSFQNFYLQEIDPLDFDPGTPPFELDLSGSRLYQIVQMIFGVVILFMSFWFYYANADIPELMMLLLSGVAAVGLGMTSFALTRYFRTITVRFADGRVYFIKNSLMKREEWEEPYTNYQGVLLKEVSEWRRRETDSATASRLNHYYEHYQILQLQHPDDNKTIPLYVTSVTSNDSAIPDHMPAPPQEKWRRYSSTFFHRPMLIMREGAISRYHPGETGTTARQQGPDV